MSYRINAWLERSDPELIISSTHTGQVLIHWRGDKIRSLIDSGQLDMSSLSSASSSSTEIVRDLLLVY